MRGHDTLLESEQESQWNQRSTHPNPAPVLGLRTASYCTENEATSPSLLANIIMAWNTSQMQAVLDRWANRRQVIPAELTGKIAPTRLQGINLRGVFRFPVERYANEILPSLTSAKTGTDE